MIILQSFENTGYILFNPGLGQKNLLMRSGKHRRKNEIINFANNNLSQSDNIVLIHLFEILSGLHMFWLGQSAFGKSSDQKFNF